MDRPGDSPNKSPGAGQPLYDPAAMFAAYGAAAGLGANPYAQLAQMQMAYAMAGRGMGYPAGYGMVDPFRMPGLGSPISSATGADWWLTASDHVRQLAYGHSSLAAAGSLANHSPSSFLETGKNDSATMNGAWMQPYFSYPGLPTSLPVVTSSSTSSSSESKHSDRDSKSNSSTATTLVETPKVGAVLTSRLPSTPPGAIPGLAAAAAGLSPATASQFYSPHTSLATSLPPLISPYPAASPIFGASFSPTLAAHAQAFSSLTTSTTSATTTTTSSSSKSATPISSTSAIRGTSTGVKRKLDCGTGSGTPSDSSWELESYHRRLEASIDGLPVTSQPLPKTKDQAKERKEPKLTSPHSKLSSTSRSAATDRFSADSAADKLNPLLQVPRPPASSGAKKDTSKAADAAFSAPLDPAKGLFGASLMSTFGGNQESQPGLDYLGALSALARSRESETRQSGGGPKAAKSSNAFCSTSSASFLSSSSPSDASAALSALVTSSASASAYNSARKTGSQALSDPKNSTFPSVNLLGSISSSKSQTKSKTNTNTKNNNKSKSSKAGHESQASAANSRPANDDVMDQLLQLQTMAMGGSDILAKQHELFLAQLQIQQSLIASSMSPFMDNSMLLSQSKRQQPSFQNRASKSSSRKRTSSNSRKPDQDGGGVSPGVSLASEEDATTWKMDAPGTGAWQAQHPQQKESVKQESLLSNGDFGASDIGSDLDKSSVDSGNGMLSDGDSDVASTLDSEAETVTPAPSVSTEDTGSDVAQPAAMSKKAVEEALRKPLQNGWSRETYIKSIGPRGIVGDVVYVAPCGKRLKTNQDINRYLPKLSEPSLKKENFSFSSKINVGTFCESKDGAVASNGVVHLTEEQVISMFEKFEKMRACKQEEKDRKLARKLQRKEQKLAHNRSSKQRKSDDKAKVNKSKAKRKSENDFQTDTQKKVNQGKSGTDRKKQKEAEKEAKLLRQEQARQEHDARMQQMLEDKKRRKMEYQAMKASEVLRKAQERELKRQQALYIKEQERERRRQQTQLMKAMEAKKKQEEKERRKEELRLQKRLEQEKAAEARRQEMIVLNELRSPVEDMCLKHSQDLPELERISGVELPGEALGECLMVTEFLHTFGSNLNLNELPTLETLQNGLLDKSADDSQELQNLLEDLLKQAVKDPGFPNPREAVTASGQKIAEVDVTEQNMSEVLRLFIRCRNGRDDQMTQWLRDKPFLCLNATQRARLLGFVCNELLCSRNIAGSIDKSIDTIHTIRKDRWVVEGSLRKLKTIQHKNFSSPIKMADAEKSDTPTKRTANGSDDEDDDKDDGVTTHDEDDDEVNKLGQEDLDKKIDKLHKQLESFKETLVVESNRLRATAYGQDRYRRRYWALPQTGAIFVEGLESGELQEELDDYPMDIKDEPNVSDGVIKGNGLLKETVESHFATKEENVKPLKLEPAMNGMEAMVASSAEMINGFHDNCSVKNEPIVKEEPMECASSIADNAVATSTPIHPTTNGISDLDGQKALATPIATACELSSLLKEEEPKRTNFADAGAAPIPPMLAPKNPAANSPPTNSMSVNSSPRTSAMNASQDQPWFSIMPRDACDETSITCLSTPVSVDPGVLSSPPVSCPRPPQTSPPAKPIDLSLPGRVSSQIVSAPLATSLAATLAAPPGAHLPTPAELMAPYQHEKAREIPRTLCRGWWQVRNMDTLRAVACALHERGLRERALLRCLDKRGQEFAQRCMEARNAEALDLPDTDAAQAAVANSTGAPARDCAAKVLDEVVRDTELGMLEELEEMEERMSAASLQIKGWKVPEKMTGDAETEARLVSHWNPDSSKEEVNILDLCKRRLAELERNVERRYIKPPFCKVKALNISNMQASSERARRERDKRRENRSGLDISAGGPNDDHHPEDTDDSSDEEELLLASNRQVPQALQRWRDAVSKATSAHALSVLAQQLNKSIAWEKSIMKVTCMICARDDNEAELLLCDSCDKGYHTYCFKPAMVNIPDGNWYCFECIARATGEPCCVVCGRRSGKMVICDKCPRCQHLDCLDPPLARVPRKWECPTCCSGKVKRGRKRKEPSLSLCDSPVAGGGGRSDADSCDAAFPSEAKKPKDVSGCASPATAAVATATATQPPLQPTQEKTSAKFSSDSSDLTPCILLLNELEKHDDAWPFLQPVNLKQFPQYKKVIKQPMDFQTMRSKMDANEYANREAFIVDVRLVFKNCDIFNEDNSPVGKAGHVLHRVFETRWKELLSS